MYLLERDYKSWNENVTYFSWNYEHVPHSYFSQKKKNNPKTNNETATITKQLENNWFLSLRQWFLAPCSRLQPAIWGASLRAAQLPSEGRSRLHRHPSSACTTPPFSEAQKGCGAPRRKEFGFASYTPLMHVIKVISFLRQSHLHPGWPES